MPATHSGQRDAGALFERAYSHIQESIVTGELPAGAVVSEAAFAKSLGISRTPVGEAIRQLAREGFVRQVPRYGTIVKPIDRQELIELYEMREALESFAASRAAQRPNPDLLARLSQFCQIMEKIGKELGESHAKELDNQALQRFLAADMAFHMTIIEAAGNRRLMEAVRTMRTLSRIFRMRRIEHDQRLVSHANEFHQQILSAISTGDEDGARRTMARHIHVGQVESVSYIDRMAMRGPATLYELPKELMKELDALENSRKDETDNPL
jgi:DNA-binding GntR family transcriptional regulator